MIEKIPELPPSTLGIRASGKITREEYRDQVLGPVHEALGSGKLNFIFESGDDFGGFDVGALWEDTKAAGTIGLKHRSDWGRIALVTDLEWMRKALAGFGWLSPGEVKVFEAGELEAAKDWVSETAG